MNTKEIASEILRQLGGNKFIAMTGSYNFSYSENKQGNPTLSMRLRKNKSGAQYLNIELTPMDVYTMRFTKLVKKTNLITVKEVDNVYCDTLQEIFTETTGLNTRL